MSKLVLCVCDSLTADRFGSLASQSIWPQFGLERLLESGVNEALILFLYHTSIQLQKNLTKSLWGLTGRAASNLLKWDAVDVNDMMKVATEPCENTMVVQGLERQSHACLWVQFEAKLFCSFRHRLHIAMFHQYSDKIKSLQFDNASYIPDFQ